MPIGSRSYRDGHVKAPSTLADRVIKLDPVASSESGGFVDLCECQQDACDGPLVQQARTLLSKSNYEHAFLELHDASVSARASVVMKQSVAIRIVSSELQLMGTRRVLPSEWMRST